MTRFSNDSQRLLLGSLAVLIAVGMGTSQAFAQSTTGNENDLNNPPVNPQQLTEVDCNVDSGDIVGIYTGNGFTGNNLGILIPELEANGFVVKTVNNINNGVPDCIVKLSIFNTDGGLCQNTPFTPLQINNIVDYVNISGGALALFNELSFCSSTNAISQAFGETPHANNVPNQIMTPGVNFDPLDPVALFTGVNAFHYNAAGQDYDPSPDAVITHSGTGDPVMITKASGLGCVLMVGDGDWIQGNFINAGDNLQMGLNIFVFLNQCIEPVGGMLLSIDTTTLFIAGVSSSAVWMIPALAGITGAGMYLAKTRIHKEN